jgi:DNA repair protein RadD
MELRNIQKAPVEKGIAFFNESKPVNSLIIAPTAFGKSLVVANVANALPDKTLVLQPSKELLEQNLNKLKLLGGEASVFSASMGVKEFGQITYTTIGSIKSLGNTFKLLGYKNLIIDEAHLYPRESDSMFGKFMQSSGIKKVLGLTATSFRLQNNVDMVGNRYSKLVMLTKRSRTAAFYKDMLHVCQISEMVESNYWAKLKYEIYDVDTSELVFNSTKADYTDDSLNDFYEDQDIEEKVIERIKTLDRKSTVVFVPSVAQAISMAQKIPDSIAVYGNLDKKSREEAINGFKSGKYKIAINVNVLSVGFDYPEIDCIICARPTASLAWFYQAMGRGTRIHPSKENCLIIDFVGNVQKFGYLEELTYKYTDAEWNVYGGGSRLLTGIPLHTIEPMNFDNKLPRFTFGRFQGKRIDEVPENYLKFCLKNVTFTPEILHIKEAIIKHLL